MWYAGVPDIRCALSYRIRPAKQSENAFSEHWVRHSSWPELMITDQGLEFVGQEFTTYVAQGGCLQHFIDSKSPWQQGRTERSGGSLKEDLHDICEEAAIITDGDFDIALTSALDARNRFSNRSGYSAQQRVFGTGLRLPGCLQSDDPVDRLAVLEDPTTEFAQTCEIRTAAQKAFFKHHDKDAVQRAALGRSRVATKFELKEGSVVYVWRIVREQRSRAG